MISTSAKKQYDSLLSSQIGGNITQYIEDYNKLIKNKSIYMNEYIICRNIDDDKKIDDNNMKISYNLLNVKLIYDELLILYKYINNIDTDNKNVNNIYNKLMDNYNIKPISGGKIYEFKNNYIKYFNFKYN